MNPIITVDDAQVKTAFARMLAEAENPSRYMTAIGGELVESTRLRFADSVSPEGSRWKPVLRGGQPLRDKGLLANSVSSQVQGNSVIVGVPYFWASVHQFGATIRAKSAAYLRFRIGKRWARKKQVVIPSRPFLGVSTSDRSAIVQILAMRLAPK